MAWEFKCDDKIQSSPVIHGDTIFFGSNDDKIYAVNINDGSLKWKVETGDNVKSSPAVVNDTVYVGSEDNVVYALNVENGNEEWTYDTGSSIVSSPSIDERQSTLYVGTEKGEVFALDSRDGLKKWETKTGSCINGSTTIFGTNIAFGNNAGNMIMLNKFTGQNVWSYNPGYVDNFAASISSSPITSGGSLFFAAEDGYVYSLDTDNKVGPTSVYTYYIVGILGIVILAGLGARMLIKRRNR